MTTCRRGGHGNFGSGWETDPDLSGAGGEGVIGAGRSARVFHDEGGDADHDVVTTNDDSRRKKHDGGDNSPSPQSSSPGSPPRHPSSSSPSASPPRGPWNQPRRVRSGGIISGRLFSWLSPGRHPRHSPSSSSSPQHHQRRNLPWMSVGGRRQGDQHGNCGLSVSGMIAAGLFVPTLLSVVALPYAVHFLLNHDGVGTVTGAAAGVAGLRDLRGNPALRFLSSSSLQRSPERRYDFQVAWSPRKKARPITPGQQPQTVHRAAPKKVKHSGGGARKTKLGSVRLPRNLGLDEEDDDEDEDDKQIEEELEEKKRTVVPMVSKKFLKRLRRSKDFANPPDKLEFNNCTLKHDWQLDSSQFPTCNLLHETDLAKPYHISTVSAHSHHGHHQKSHNKDRASKIWTELFNFVSHGHYRDVWSFMDPEATRGGDGDDNKKYVMKTLRYEHEFRIRHYDRHRRDALVMERLTGSDYIVNIYGYCGNSGFFESGTGDIYGAIWPGRRNTKKKLSKLDKLRMATEAALGVAAVHSIDGKDHVSVSHTDIADGQFILIDGHYKLNDFNRARFIRYRPSKHGNGEKQCGFYIGNNPGNNRSPEEYRYDYLTEKIDVYSLGNIFYELLEYKWAFERFKEEDAQRRIKNGERPRLSKEVQESTDPIDVAIVEAMRMCHIHDPGERAPAQEVADFLQSKLKEIEAGN